MMIPFVKYSGCGNDFIIVDNQDHSLTEYLSPIHIQHLCHRRFGIGADGLIVFERSHPTHFHMRIFNSDGSEAEMCGNGIRCLAHFIHGLFDINGEFTIETMLQQIHVRVENGVVTVFMPLPSKVEYNVPLNIDEEEVFVHALDTGVPHVVRFVDDIDCDLLMKSAPKIRFHPKFFPKGTNVNFAQLLPNGIVSIRTYERGIEGETLACGTGAVAVAVAASKIYGLSSPIKIKTRSSDVLEISFDHSSSYVAMTGPAVKVFDGHCKITG